MVGSRGRVKQAILYCSQEEEKVAKNYNNHNAGEDGVGDADAPPIQTRASA